MRFSLQRAKINTVKDFPCVILSVRVENDAYFLSKSESFPYTEPNSPRTLFLNRTVRENPLTKRLYHPRMRSYREQQAARKDRPAPTPGIREGGRRGAAPPRRGHVPTLTPSRLSLELSSGGEFKGPRRTCPVPSLARVLSTKPGYQMEHLQLPRSEAGVTLGSPSCRGHVKR